MSDAPEPGARLAGGEPAVPRPAATVILLRGGAALEVLLAKRSPAARFMASAWVFPGGSVGAEDGAGHVGLRAAAARELAEEVGITLASDAELVEFSRWITPEEVAIRFDTYFFLAAGPAAQEPAVDGREIVDARWFAPEQALRAADAGAIRLVLPTIAHLRRLARFASADDLLDHARGRRVEPVRPRLIGSGEQARIVLPGDPGHAG